MHMQDQKSKTGILISLSKYNNNNNNNIHTLYIVYETETLSKPRDHPLIWINSTKSPQIILIFYSSGTGVTGVCYKTQLFTCIS